MGELEKGRTFEAMVSPENFVVLMVQGEGEIVAEEITRCAREGGEERGKKLREAILVRLDSLIRGVNTEEGEMTPDQVYKALNLDATEMDRARLLKKLEDAKKYLSEVKIE